MKKLATILGMIAVAVGIIAVSCKKEPAVQGGPQEKPENTVNTFWNAAKAGDAETLADCVNFTSIRRVAFVEGYQNKMDKGVWSDVKDYKILDLTYNDAKDKAEASYVLIDKNGKYGNPSKFIINKVGDKWLLDLAK